MATVEIYGRLYNIRGDYSAETIRVLARYVDHRMRQVHKLADTGDAARLAVLTALNIADDYYRTHKALERREGEVAEEARRLAEVLDAAIDASLNAVSTERVIGSEGTASG